MILNWAGNVNEIKDAVYNTIKNAKIKNIKGVITTVYKRNIPSKPSHTNCPMIAVFKRNASGDEIKRDQPSLELPRRVYIVIGICDFSMADLDEAEVKTDDLINKIIIELSKNPSLNGLVSGIEVENITWDEANDDDVWFSTPMIELSVVGTKL